MADELPPFVPTDDADVREYVRQVTDYNESTLNKPTLRAKLDIAKSVLYMKTNSDAFYDDAPLGVALVFTTALLAKNAVENYSVTRWNIGNQYIDAGTESSSGDSQIQQWNTFVRMGIRRSDETPTGPRNTADYIG
ncbi:hypothetical protein PN419_00340 [Halorubrum ezzemoulense]|uniref:hypothetical protein n=1 Tax=Halorubrum ezzemoulense TaxID=337243 RepID=UPI002330F197|nr:hypothetical protein [Halorubrum ezzemoulense]MDB9247455.1 hypothetical protein [Halorubrum ezzemoulense]MDB9258636.1 hypothetical protein [Halorubrum ezzemoulense]MDB9264506.1 hypothetical protein [Halorubrum ezzemoulense]MDB9268997.1 hypothetical protein [Halorubrum ezzemoulense]MDB9271474.1 hypothetical protein [Halorubrum ezzemoulense]